MSLKTNKQVEHVFCGDAQNDFEFYTMMPSRVHRDKHTGSQDLSHSVLCTVSLKISAGCSSLGHLTNEL